MNDPWFTLERGRFRYRLTPRNAKGWLATLAFTLALLVPLLGLPLLLLPMFGASPLLMLAAVPVALVIVLLFVRWAEGRSVVEESVSAEELNEFRDWKRRNGRR